MKRSQAAAIIAGTVADAVRERLITYTPVATGHQALILAYTTRQSRALDMLIESDRLDPALYADIPRAIAEATVDAAVAGFTIPTLPEE